MASSVDRDLDPAKFAALVRVEYGVIDDSRSNGAVELGLDPAAVDELTAILRAGAERTGCEAIDHEKIDDLLGALDNAHRRAMHADEEAANGA